MQHRASGGRHCSALTWTARTLSPQKGKPCWRACRGPQRTPRHKPARGSAWCDVRRYPLVALDQLRAASQVLNWPRDVSHAKGFPGQPQQSVAGRRREEAVPPRQTRVAQIHGNWRWRLRNLAGLGHQRHTTRPITSATPYARESSAVKELSDSTHQPSPWRRIARLTTSRSGRARNRATTTSPARTWPPRRTRTASPCRSVGTIDGPATCATNMTAPTRM